MLINSRPTTDKSVMQLAVISTDIVPASPLANLAAVESLLWQLPGGTHLAVLPELFSTGFIHDPQKLKFLAESDDGPTVERLHDLAAQLDIAIAGSFLAEEDGHYFNRGFFIKPTGEITFYDKRHLFMLSPEKEVYSAGEALPPVVEYLGWNIAMIVCYDLRFPVWSRNVGQHYDMLLVPANWPVAREYAWHHLLVARAIENQAVVVGADRSGADNFGSYDGMSQIYDAMGMPKGEQFKDLPVVLATISLDDVKKIRQSLPVAGSADSFRISQE